MRVEVLDDLIRAKAISHVGIAVADMEKAVQDFCSLFQFEHMERHMVESEGVQVALLKVGSSEIELLSPTREGTSIGKFLREKGEGIHHLAIRVPDVSDAINDANRLGLRMLDDEPRMGAKGSEAAFVHPKSIHGVLLEFYNR